MNNINMPNIWAILPEELTRIQYQYLCYVNGTPDYRAMIEARNVFGFEADSAPETFFMDGNIGVLPIEGIILPKGDIFTAIFGGAAPVDIMTRDFKSLLKNEEVSAIVLDINSGGGSPFAVQEFADLVFQSRDIKPIFTISSGVMASAAIWVGAAAGEIIITSETVMTGSIGTLAKHIEISKLEEQLGIKTTIVRDSEFKAVPSGVEPLSEKGRAVLEGQVKHITAAFVSDIARFRGVGVDVVRSDMGQGRVFVGSQGIEAGLIDGIMSSEEFMDAVRLETANFNNN